MTDIVIAGALRTAIGKFGGSLAKIPAPELGATVIKALLAQHGVAPEQVSEVIMGQVLTAASGQNPARQALIKAGIPERRARDDHQRGVRLGPEGRDARRAGGAMRRRRHRHRRRPGEHERLAARAARLARRLPHGRRQAGRHDDRRRPVGRLQPVPHGHHRRERRQEVQHVARAAGRVRGGEPEQGRGRAEGRQVQRRDRSGADPAAQGRSGRVQGRRVHQGGHDARLGRRVCVPRVRQGRHA